MSRHLKQSFKSQVPFGVKERDHFTVRCPDGTQLLVSCPDGLREGDVIDIKVYEEFVETHPWQGSVVLASPSNSERTVAQAQRRAEVYSLVSWGIFFNVILFILLTLGYALPFARQNISPGCNVVNAIDQSSISTLYYITTQSGGGLSSQQNQCQNNEKSFCYPWTSEAWGTFSSIARRFENYFYTNFDVYFSWNSAQVLIPLSSAFTGLALILSTLSCYCFYHDKQKIGMQLLVMTIYASLITFFTVMWGYNAVANSVTLSTAAWEGYYQTLFSAPTTVAIPLTVTAAPTNCIVSVHFMDGGNLVLAGVIFSFFGWMYTIYTTCAVAAVVSP